MFKANEMNVQRQNNNRIRSQKSENPAIQNLLMTGWKEEEENGTNM